MNTTKFTMEWQKSKKREWKVHYSNTGLVYYKLQLVIIRTYVHDIIILFHILSLPPKD